MASLPPKPVVVLPESSPHRQAVTQVLKRLGAPVAGLPVPADAEVAVVDLSGPGGHAALESLLKTSTGAKLSVIGVLQLKDAPGELVGVADFVSADALADELPLRLARARARQLSYRQAMQRERETQVLLELTARYAGSADVEDLLHDVTRRLAEELDIDRAALVMIDEGAKGGRRGRLERRPRAQGPAASTCRATRKFARWSAPASRSSSRTAPSHPLLEDVKESVAKTGIRYIAALPLVVSKQGARRAAVAPRRASAAPSCPREIDFLATVSHATAIALRNAQRIETMRGETEKEKEAAHRRRGAGRRG